MQSNFKRTFSYPEYTLRQAGLSTRNQKGLLSFFAIGNRTFFTASLTIPMPPAIDFRAGAFDEIVILRGY
jgi:hypothetical protein